MSREKLIDPTQVRFPKTLKSRLDDAAKRFGFPASELVRRAVEMKLPEWEQTGEFVVRVEGGVGRFARTRNAATAIAVSALLAGMAISAHAPGMDQNSDGTMPLMATSAE